MITSTIHVLIPVPVFFLLIERRARRRARLDELKGLADLNLCNEFSGVREGSFGPTIPTHDSRVSHDVSST